MNDRQLLELAAKAAGIEVVWLESSYYGPTMARVEVKSGEGEITEPWNPLTDDGDALRLAVKLVERQGEMLLAWIDGKIDFGDTVMQYASEDQGTDPYTATRRAIVTAAAEIGKEMA